MDNSLHYRIDRLTAKRRMPYTKRVHQATETEEIGLCVAGFAADLLWRHILWRSGQCAAACKTAVACRSSQAEVRNPHSFRPLIQKYVAGLDIAMDEPLPMSCRKCRGNLQADSDDLHHFQRSLLQ